jgi:hypothetical protein
VRRALSILVLVFIAIGIILAVASVLLPYPAIDIARTAFLFYLAASAVLFLGREFIKGLRQGLSGEETGPTVCTTLSAPPPPPAPQRRVFTFCLQIVSGIAFILSVVLGLAGNQQMAAGLFALSFVLGVILGVLHFVRSVVQGYDQALRDQRFIAGCCLHCGYDLRGSVTTLCPECGERIPENYAQHPQSTRAPLS